VRRGLGRVADASANRQPARLLSKEVIGFAQARAVVQPENGRRRAGAWPVADDAPQWMLARVSSQKASASSGSPSEQATVVLQ
jgi:hypothetical protein